MVYNGFVATGIYSLSILMLFKSALGAQADPTSPLNTPIANEYYLNAEGALMFSVLLQSPSLLGIYAIFNICFYLHMSHLKEDIERCIILQGVMIKMAQSMGLRKLDLCVVTNEGYINMV
jgi:hypothetical protein